MTQIKLPYGNEFLEAELPEEQVNAVLVSDLQHYQPGFTQEALIEQAMASPVGTPALSQLAKGKKKIVLIASDHTRPVPSKLIVPPMLSQIRQGSPDAEITILIATGCHRSTKKEELIAKFGEKLYQNEKIVIHNCDDEKNMVKIGTLPSGGQLKINRLAAEADLLVSEGFIEPHFFAGFSGGRKSVLPGVASRATVLYNHNAQFINSPYARTGVFENNPIHKDMLYAAKVGKLAYIVNVVINSKKEVIYAVAGDCEKAHQKGCDFLNSRCKVNRVMSDIVLTSNGGYPLDQNIYQAVKGMTAAEACVNKDGVIIMVSKSSDGHGGEGFYKTFKEAKDVTKLLDGFLATPSENTIPDQWQSQIFARILKRARIIYVSEAPDEIVQDLHMVPAHSLNEAIKKANVLLGGKKAGITVIPDGVSVIVQ